MKILERKPLHPVHDIDGYQIAIKARLNRNEAKNPMSALYDHYYVIPCRHSHDCCGCICHSHVINIRKISARRVKATINFYRNV